MLKIVIPKTEGWDDNKEEFVNFPGQTLTLEHSLVSISKWEARWHKPFLDDTKKTYDETIDYVRCMTLTQNVDPKAYYFLTDENIKEINDYIEDPMTATWFSDDPTKETHRKVSSSKITSELIYYWMVAFNIPTECQKWHFNRLMTLIRICQVKNDEQYGKTKGLSKKALVNNYASLNAARRKAWNTKG